MERIVLIAILILTSVVSQLTIHLIDTQILSSSQQFRMKFRVDGGYGPYILTCPNSPPYVICTESYLFYPREPTQGYYQVPIQIQFADAKGQITQATIIAVTNGVKLFLDNTLYPFNLTLAIEPILPSSQGTTAEKVSNIISRSQQGLTIPYQTIDDVFESLPNLQQLQRILDSNDLLLFVKSVSSVPGAKLNCIQKVAYLSQLEGSAYILQYQKQNQLDKTLAQPSGDVFKLGLDKNTLNSPLGQSIQAIQQMYSGLSDMLADYKINYELYNSHLSEFVQLMESIVLLKVRESELLNQRDRIAVDVTTNNIRLAKQQISSQKIAIAENSTALRQTIKQIDSDLSKLRVEIATLEAQVPAIQNQKDESQLVILIQEVDIETLSQRINAQNEKFDKYSANLLQNSPQKRFYSLMRQKAALQTTLLIISQCVTSLQRQIDTQYYTCYGVPNTHSNIEPGLSLNVIPYSSFAAYTKGAFNVSISQDPLQQSSDISLVRTNILSSIWTENFGKVVSPGPINLTNNFTCLGSGQVRPHTSSIRSISGNIMKVWSQPQGTEYLLLGACTRIQLAVSFPAQGSAVFWRGQQVSGNIFDVYFMLVL